MVYWGKLRYLDECLYFIGRFGLFLDLRLGDVDPGFTSRGVIISSYCIRWLLDIHEHQVG
ncbi:hypothetical protein NBRC116593_32720 [Sulfitobacter pacificus]